MSKLILFFNGWSMDDSIVSHLELNEYDLKIVDANQEIEYDKLNELLKKYDDVIVIGYSIGVWFANKFIIKYNLDIKSIAINGCSKIIDDTYGIPTSNFKHMVENMSDEMVANFDLSAGKNIQRNKSLQLISKDLREFFNNYQPLDNVFKNIIISKNDKIVPVRNLMRFYKGCSIVATDYKHYLFDNYKSWDDIIRQFYA